MISAGKYFHKKCMKVCVWHGNVYFFIKLSFKCSVCGNTLNGTYFTFLNKLICEKDYKLVQKSCAECHQPISDVYYTLDDGTVLCENDYKVNLSKDYFGLGSKICIIENTSNLWKM